MQPCARNASPPTVLDLGSPCCLGGLFWAAPLQLLPFLFVFQVLNMYGKVVTVRHQAVTRKKDNRFAVALDSEQNNIHVKDIVKVIDGPHSVGTVGLGVTGVRLFGHLGLVLVCHRCSGFVGAFLGWFFLARREHWVFPDSLLSPVAGGCPATPLRLTPATVTGS